ncbi:MAG: PDZ domain-containing protein, partial [Verrucomicrobiota bacterium]
PLFDWVGTVVGIHSWIGEDVQTNTHAGVSGFVEDWKRLLGSERWGRLLPPPRMREGAPLLGIVFENGVGDVRIDTVVPNSAAEAANLRVGDVILRVDGLRVTAAEFRQYLPRLKAGDEIVLDVLRGRQELFARVELGAVSELPFVTARGKQVLEEQAEAFFGAFGRVTGSLGSGVVYVFVGKRPVGYGMVWEGNRVLTKWSEIEGAESLSGLDAAGRSFGLRVVEVFAEEHDLAVLEPVGKGVLLEAMALEEEMARAGELVAAVRPDGVPEGVGVVSVRERSLLEEDRGFLGVALEPEFRGPGALILDVTPKGAAREAGIEGGDVILELDGRTVDGFQELKTLLNRAGPGQAVSLRIRREEEELVKVAKLQGNPMEKAPLGRRARMMDTMDERGLSRVRDYFSRVIQTDMTLRPNECGLPVVNLEGKAVGMVIARAGRVKTYVLPVGLIRELFSRPDN